MMAEVERVGKYRVQCPDCGTSFRVIKGDDQPFPNCLGCGGKVTDDDMLMVEWLDTPQEAARKKKQTARQQSAGQKHKEE
jgi:hypothetical protein